MKTGSVCELYIEKSIFPSTGIAHVDEKNVMVKNTFPGQRVLARIGKRKKDYLEAKLLKVIENMPFAIEENCPHFHLCGGCNSQFIPYEMQLQLKETQVMNLFSKAGISDFDFLGIEGAPEEFQYRNKMEFTFGDEEKDGLLNLGMHLKGRNFGIVNTNQCRIVDEDFRALLNSTVEYFRGKDLPYYKVKSRKGYLRNLVVRKGKNTGEILVNLVTTSQVDFNMEEFKDTILGINLQGKLVGIVHSVNDSISDVVKTENLEILYGRDYIIEEISGLKFKIWPGAFFQTNSKGAETLYGIVKEFLGDVSKKTVFDLYCGTGTIGQIVASEAKNVIGVELVEDAIKAANENAAINGIENCRFIAGDVAKVIDSLEDTPDVIILDPPRPGVHPKALKHAAAFGARSIVYVSCNPKTLVKDLEALDYYGYRVDKVKLMDMFPHTGHVETVVLLTRIEKTT